MNRIRMCYTQEINFPRPINPPLMAHRDGPSYKEMANRPAKSWKVKPNFQHHVNNTKSKSEVIQRTLRDLRNRSTRTNPICLRCGSSGHMARDCRNGQLCFICNKIGHKSQVCSATASYFPPTPPPKPFVNPQSDKSRVVKPQRKRFATMAAPLHTLIITLTPTRESEMIEKEFAQSFILDDIGGWGPVRIERTLAKKIQEVRSQLDCYDLP